MIESKYLDVKRSRSGKYYWKVVLLIGGKAKSFGKFVCEHAAATKANLSRAKYLGAEAELNDVDTCGCDECVDFLLDKTL